MINEKRIKRAISALLGSFGEDVSREGLLNTPERVSRAYVDILSGYGRSLKKELTVFKNVNNYDDIVYSGNIDFFSTCEHHLLPFFGKAHIAYIPDKELIGLSKLSRAIDIFSRRLQDQERITVQVANELNLLLKPKGVAIMLEAQHLCNMARGVEQFNSNMKTSIFLGAFKEEEELRERFLRMSIA